MLFLQSVACSKNKSSIIFPSTENHSLLKEPSVSEPMNLDDEEEKRSGDVWTDSQLTVSHLHHRESQTPGVWVFIYSKPYWFAGSIPGPGL